MSDESESDDLAWLGQFQGGSAVIAEIVDLRRRLAAVKELCDAAPGPLSLIRVCTIAAAAAIEPSEGAKS